jgi:hypothetical protein
LELIQFAVPQVSTSSYKIAWTIPTWNGARLGETLSTIPSGEVVEVISTKDRHWPLAQAWNYAAEKYLLDGSYDVLIIANDDVVVRPNTGQDLAHGLLSAQFDPETPCLGSHPDGKLLLVSGYSLNHGFEDVGCRWGVGAPDYSCFAIGAEYVQRIGPFDESFDPCYFEDNDSHRRIRLAGYEAAQWTPYFHHGSTTLTTDLERLATISGEGGAFGRCRSYYIQKWGGGPGEETFREPFNGGTALSVDLPREIPSAVSDAEAHELTRLARGQTVLELGAQYGFSSVVLARVARRLHAVDWHKGDSMTGRGESLPTFLENLNRHCVADKVITHVGRFEDVLPAFSSRFFNGCFIDGEHNRQSVTRDSELALRLVKKGGWIAWHDYGRFEVAEVVDMVAANEGAQLKVVDYLAVMVKP